MQVRFWGVRGSLPSPMTGDEFAARLNVVLTRFIQKEKNPHDFDPASVRRWISALPPELRQMTGGNTPCVELRTDSGQLFIIDLGSGARVLGEALLQAEFGKGQGHAHIFLSHFHWDHIQGWPFFKPIYISGNQFEIWSHQADAEKLLREQQCEPFFPPASWVDRKAGVHFRTLHEGEAVEVGSICISSQELDHPSASYAFRFEEEGRAFVYATDGAYNYLDSVAMEPFIEFFRNADVLVFDSQFSLEESREKHSWGHSSGIIGVELACHANVKKVVLFHHNPGSSDENLYQLLEAAREHAQTIPCQNTPEVVLAYEGLELKI
jgi:phosphoribosyl 1,2-cyclic phosphodiesterase